MNHIYRTLWSVATQSWQAVPENARTGGKKSTSNATGVVASVALSWVLTSGAHAQSPPAINQLPTNGVVARGTATINQTATAQAAAMTVNQSSQRAVINWNSFNLGQSASVNFVQPNAQAVTLNRVNDSNPSQIFGRITANGQVFLSNANGVYFSPTSSVDVGAFTATTHNINNDNFMSGKYVFERNGATGKVVNEGAITAGLGGYVALLAPEVQNAGVVVARAGTVAMAAGEMITLSIDGAGNLAGITTTPSTIATLVENKHAVLAPDGQIILSAVALDKLQAGVIKNSGSLEANSISHKGGKVFLEGDDITLTSTSKIEAKGPAGGGTVLVGGDWQGSGTLRQATKVTMEAGATIDASATTNGDGGKVVLWSDVHNADSVTLVHGNIKAEAGPNGGDGGKVETSGNLLNVDGIQVSTHSSKGNVGSWLLDPHDFSIDTAANGGNMTGAALGNLLANNDITIQSGTGTNTATTYYGTTGTLGNIYVKDAVSWSANTTLTLAASNNIYISAPITASGASAGIKIFYGGSNATTAPAAGTFYLFDLTIPGNNYISITGSSASLKIADKTYTLIQSIADIPTMSASGTYALGQSQYTPGVYASSVYNGNFTGTFDGLGNSIIGIQLTNQVPNQSPAANCTANCYIGFFAQASGGAQIKNLLLNEVITISGPATATTYTNYAVGGLVGQVTSGTSAAPNVFSGIGVTLVENTQNASALTIQGYWGGGLVGKAYSQGSSNPVYANVSQSFASLNVDNTGLAAVSGSSIGGIFGEASASVTAAAGGGTGAISISATYVSGSIKVRQTNGYWGVGGLIGQAYGPAVTASDSYTYFQPNSLTSTGGTASVGGLKGWTTTLTLTNSYSTYTGTNDATNKVYYSVPLTGNTSLLTGLNPNLWKITNGAVVLANLPTPASPPGVPIFVKETQTSGTYGNLGFSYSLVDVTQSPVTLNSGNYVGIGISGTPTYNINNTTGAGAYSVKYLSGLSLTDLVANSGASAKYSLYAYPNNYTISKAHLTVTANNASKIYGDANPSFTTTVTGFVNADTSSVLSGAGSATTTATATTGVGSAVITAGVGSLSAANYDFTTFVPATLTITPKNLTVSGSAAANKTYDKTTTAFISGGTLVGVVNGDSVTLTEAGTFAQAGVGTWAVTAADSLSGAAASNYTLTQPTLANATITAKTLGLSIPGATRVYDGTTTISLSGPVALIGVVGSDQVNLGVSNVTGYVDKNVGTNKTATYSGLTLSGSDVANYTLPTNPTSNANITPASLSISGFTVADKTYDGGTTATVNAANVQKSGLIAGDVVTVTATGSFADKNVGTAKVVNLLSTYSGTDVGNYTITDQLTTTASIAKAPLTVTAVDASKNFGQINPQFTVALTGFVGGETASASGVTGTGSATSTATALTDAKTAVITAGLGTLAASNYSFASFVDGTLTIKPIVAMNNAEVSTMIGAQLANLTGAQVSSFSATQLQVFSAQQISALSPAQLAGMTTSQVLALSPTQIAALSPAKIALMSATELSAFSNEQLQALSVLQIAAIEPAHFAAFSPEQIMALSISQVVSLTPDQLRGFSPAQVASLSAAEIAYFDARQLAAIGIFPKVETPVAAAPPVIAPPVEAPVPPAIATSNQLPLDFETPSAPVQEAAAPVADKKEEKSKFEAAIPVMTEVATLNASPAVVAVVKPTATAVAVQPSEALGPRTSLNIEPVSAASSRASTGVLAITILNSVEAKPVTAGVAYEQDDTSVSLHMTSAPSIPPASEKLVFVDKLTTFMMSTSTGEIVEFQGSLVNKRLVVVASTAFARRVARTDMNAVLAAAITSLGAENRVMLANLDGVVLDLR